LKRYQQELQLCLRPHPNRRVELGVIVPQSCGSPEIKNHLDVGLAEKHIAYYMGEGGGFPQV
jgi:hypothetical protein